MTDERKRVIAMIALFAACAMFWAGFEQTGASLNLFADRHTDRVIFGWDMPAGVLQGVNPAVHHHLRAGVRRDLGATSASAIMDPSAPFKFALGLILMGVGFLVMFLAARYVVMGEKVLPTWLMLTYLLHTFGELCLSPVGLSSMTKLAPARFVGQVMGLWFLATAIGNNLAGQFAGEIDPNNLPGMPGQFLYLFWWGCISGAVLLVLTPFIRKKMAGVEISHWRRPVTMKRQFRTARGRDRGCHRTGQRLQPRRVAERGGSRKESADQFVERLNREMTELGREQAAAGWAYATFINQDTEFLNAKATERYLEYFSNAVEAAKAYENQQLSPATARTLQLLKLGVAAPAPKDRGQARRARRHHLEDGRHVRRREVLPERPGVLQGSGTAHRRDREQPQLRRADRGVDGLALDRAAAAQGVRALRRARERRRDASWASRISARCGARVTTCRPTTSRKRRRGCGARSSRCTTRCTATCAARCRRPTARSACPMASRFPPSLLGNMWAQQWAEIYPLVEPYPGASTST